MKKMELMIKKDNANNTTLHQNMKKIVFRFWTINLLISVVLFVVYRIVISQTGTIDGGFFKTILQMLDILLNLAYSIMYLIAMFFCSGIILLNLVDKIRNNFYLSLLTFLGIPLFCVIFIISTVLINDLLHSIDLFRNLVIFSIVYLLATTLEFLIFRKKVKNIQLNR